MNPPSNTRRLRRSRTDRIGAGVAGGLGEYFGIDPVVFRVLFATAAFFGGAGVLGYLVAWAAIPEEGTENAPVDGWVRSLRQRRVPVWVIAVAAGLLLWFAAFSWWAPGPFFPVLAVVIILVVIFGRRGEAGGPPSATSATPSAAAAQAGAAPTVRLTKDDVPGATAAEPTAGSTGAGSTGADSSAAEWAAAGSANRGPADTLPPRSAWRSEAASWVAEARAARRERLRRAFPVKLATLVTLGATLLTLGLIDAAHGIAVPLYFWFSTAVLAGGLLIGMSLRRTPWSITTLLVPAVVGLIAFAGSHVSLHDGVGQRTWIPSHGLASDYDLAFGNSTLDLTSLDPQNAPRSVQVDQAAGQIFVVAPKTMNLTVVANVRFGAVSINNAGFDQSGGVGVSRVVEPLPGATGSPITVHIHLSAGHVDVTRR